MYTPFICLTKKAADTNWEHKHPSCTKGFKSNITNVEEPQPPAYYLMAMQHTPLNDIPTHGKMVVSFT